MKIISIVIFFLLFLTITIVPAQNQHTVDSLLKILPTVIEDSEEKISILLELANQLINNTPNQALEYSIEALRIAEKNKYTREQAESLIKIAKINREKGDLKLAMESASKALRIAEANNHTIEIIIAQRNIGFIYNYLGDYDKSSEYFFNCLKLSEELGDQKQVSNSLNSIGYSYFDQKNYEKALEYYLLSLDIARETNARGSISAGLNNIAAALAMLGNFEQYKPYVLEAIKINKAIGQLSYLTINYMNLGYYFDEMGMADSAVFYNNMALNLARENGNILQELSTRINIATQNFKEGNISRSQYEALDILRIAQENGYKKFIHDAAELLEKTYSLNNDYKNAYTYNSLRWAMKDSLDLNDKLTELSKFELIYEFDKNEQQQKSYQQRKDLIYILIGITLLLILVLVISSLRRHKMKSKISNLEKLKLQDELDFKNKELTSNVMSLMKKNEMLNEFSSRLLEIEQDAIKAETKNAIHRISKELQKSVESEIWSEFEIRFKEVHSDFYNILIKKYPDLTPNELRLSAFLKLNMSTKEISELTGQTINAIEMGRFRLRKKLSISGTDENLVTFLTKV